MKSKKKLLDQLPEVQIRGNLKDVRKLIKQVNKKRSVVIFRDAENDLLFVEYDKKIIELSDKDISALENKHRLIYFNFFPSAASRQVSAEKKDKEAKVKKKAKKGKDNQPREEKRKTARKSEKQDKTEQKVIDPSPEPITNSTVSQDIPVSPAGQAGQD